MKGNNFFKKINDKDDIIFDIDNTNSRQLPKDSKYIYYPPTKKVSISTPPPPLMDPFLHKELIKEPIKELIKEPIEESNEEPIKESNEEPIKEINNESDEEKKSELNLIDMENPSTIIEETGEEDDQQPKNVYSEDDLLFNLKIISELNINDKLSYDAKLFRINTTSYTQGLYRWWYNEDRAKTLEKLNEIIDATFEYIDKTFTNKLQPRVICSKEESVLYENNSQIMQKFYVTLVDAIKGLETLRNTYATDKSMTTGLGLLIDRIRTRTDNIKNHLVIKTK